MSVVAKPLFTAAYASNAQTTVYTVPTSVRTIIDKCGAYNGTGIAATLAINLIPYAGSAGASNLVMTKSIAPGEAYVFPEVVGHVLEAGAAISVLAGTASAIVLRISGREVY
jgi:hypothetical protein